MMKIVHVANYYQPDMGYQENKLPYHQKLLGHDVRVMTSDRYLPFEGYEKYFVPILGKRVVGTGIYSDKGIAVERLPVYFEIAASQKILFRRQSFLARLQEIDPDVVHFDNEHNLNLVYLRAIRRRTRARVIVDCHSDYQNSRLARVHNSLFLWALKIGYRWLVADLVEKFLPVNESSRQHLAELYGIESGKLVINRLGIDSPDTRSVRRNVHRKQLNIEDDDIVFIASGKFNLFRRADLLLRSLASIVDRQPRAKVILVGIVYEEVRGLVRSDFVVVPFQPYKKLQQYYQVSDVAVFTSVSATILDAMKIGMPILVFDEPNIRFYLDGEKNGMPFKSEPDFSEKAEWLIKNPSLRRRMGKNSKNFVNDNLTWEQIAKETLEIYGENQFLGAPMRKCELSSQREIIR